MSIKRKWLKIVLLLMLAGASFGPLDPKKIEEDMRIMNESRITIPDRNERGDGDPS